MPDSGLGEKDQRKKVDVKLMIMASDLKREKTYAVRLLAFDSSRES